MTLSEHNFLRIERRALTVAGPCLVIAAVLAWREPGGVLGAWRLAVFACLQPAIGSLIFVLIFRLTNGQWMRDLRPFLHSGVGLLPWVWLLVVPAVWFVPDPAAQLLHAFSRSTERHFNSGAPLYFSRPFFIARVFVYAALFFLFRFGAQRVMLEPDRRTMRWFGPAGLIGLVFVLHLVAVDWLILLQPGWYSTGFPLEWTIGQAVSGLALAVLAAVALGADPSRRGPTRQFFGIDWGNLLLASVMVWMYVAFTSYLIIWSGNLPAEISWYVPRQRHAWYVITPLLFLIDFAIPFLLLLSRRLKRGRGSLVGIAALVVIGQVSYTIWLILPAYAGVPAATLALDLTLLAAGAALFLNRYFAGARRLLGTIPPSPS
jgi:hypothetical protein